MIIALPILLLNVFVVSFQSFGAIKIVYGDIHIESFSLYNIRFDFVIWSMQFADPLSPHRFGTVHRNEVRKEKLSRPLTFSPEKISSSAFQVSDMSSEAVLLWYTDIREAGPTPERWKSLLQDVANSDREEYARITRFLFPDDQKRAYLSGLLQKAAVRSSFGASNSDFTLRRTAEVSDCVEAVVVAVLCGVLHVLH